MNEATINKNLERVKRLYKKLAKAETVKGQEAGLLNCYAFFITCYNTNAQRNDKAPFTAEEWQSILEKIPTQEEWTIYSMYKQLLNVIVDGYNYYLERLVSFEKGYNANMHELYDLRLAEDRQRKIDSTPLVVTEDEFKRLYDLTIECLHAQKESYYSLFFTVITNFLAEPDKAPEAVKDAFNVYKQIIFDEEKNTTAYDLLAKAKPFKDNDTDNKIFLEVFKDRYKVLYTAVESYLESNGFTLSGADNDLFKKRYAWQELDQKGIIGFVNVMQPTNKSIGITLFLKGGKTKENWSRSQRAFSSGIAIMHNPNPAWIDDNGNYKEPANNYLVPLTIDDKAYPFKETKDSIEYNVKELMYPSIQEVYAFNEVLALVQQAYKIDDLTEVFGVRTGKAESLTDFYNKTRNALYNEVYGTDQVVEEKQKLIKDIFKEIDLKPYHPTADNKEFVKKIIFDVKFNPEKFLFRFTSIKGLVRLMMKGEKQ